MGQIIRLHSDCFAWALKIPTAEEHQRCGVQRGRDRGRRVSPLSYPTENSGYPGCC